MALEILQDKIPAYANDIKLNLSTVTRQTELDAQQLWGTLVACAMACGQHEVISQVQLEAAAILSESEIQAAKTASALMSMNNVYYRFQHLSTNEKYRTMPARLRMNGMRTHGVDQKLFELWSLAVSAINACGTCVDSHEKTLKEHGVSEEVILAAVRVASIIEAASSILRSEAA